MKIDGYSPRSSPSIILAGSKVLSVEEVMLSPEVFCA